MDAGNHFPNSARSRWLKAREARRAAHTLEARANRAVASALEVLLRVATQDQLRQVARILGKSDSWVDLVRLDAKNPGAVGKACLKAAR